MIDAVEVQGGELRSGATIQVGGFKHLAVVAIAAAVVIDGRVRLANVPMVEDVRVMAEMLARMGASVDLRGDALELDCAGLRCAVIPQDLMERIHGGLYLIPALLARLGRVTFGAAGGCRIGPRADGARPVQHIMDVLARFGAGFAQSGDQVTGVVHGLAGVEIDIAAWSTCPPAVDGPLVSGATKTAIIAGALARGTTVIRNPYLRTEIVELIALLSRHGVDIAIQEGDIVISGRVRAARPAPFTLIPDLIEVITYCSCAVHCRIPIRIDGLPVPTVRRALSAEFSAMAGMGIAVRWTDRSLTIPRREGVLAPFDLVADSTGIYSDAHPFFALMALHAGGTSRIRERIWTRRFGYVPELVKLGARMTVVGDEVRIAPGPVGSGGQTVMGADLRAAAVLAIASLTIPGRTRLHGVRHLARGYGDFFATLRQLGAVIVVPSAEAACRC